MPWDSKGAKAHDKKAVGKKGKQWAGVANAVLAKTGDDGKAVRIANGVVKGKKKK